MMFINCGRATKDHICPKILLFTSVLAGGICQLYCPELAELGNSAQLTCIYPNDKYVSYRRPYGDSVVAACDPDSDCTVTGGGRYSATNINETHSRLMITNIQVSDGGDWICEDAFSGVMSRCIIYPFKTPACHITSGNDTDYMDIHENISLSVNITNYYCSTPIDFQLRAGNTEEVLIKSTVNEINITSDVFYSTFNVTESHIGSMELIFICNNVRKTVQCGSVQTLRKRLPMCNITADGDERGWDIGDEITMSVYIEDYFCSGDLELFLQTGGETDRLNVTGIYNETITFKVKESHFGHVYLNINCNDVSRNLTCDGIQHLSESSFDVKKISVIAGTIAAMSCIVIFGILITWFLKVHTTKSKLISVACQANIGPNDMGPEDLGASAEVGDINETEFVGSVTGIEMVSAVGFANMEEIRKERQRLNKTETDGNDRTLDDLFPVRNRQSLESNGYVSINDEITVPVTDYDVSLESGSDVRSNYHHLQLGSHDHIYTTVYPTSPSRCTII